MPGLSRETEGRAESGTAEAVPPPALFSRDGARLWLVCLLGRGLIVVAREELRQRIDLIGLHARSRQLAHGQTQRLGQPARAIEQPFGLLRHVGLS